MINEDLKQNSNKIRIVIAILIVLGMVVGSTFAYWNWQSNVANQTAVTFTVSSGFSCSADGGGDITSNDVELAPASCTNSTYAIQRPVVVSTTQDAGKTIYLDMWLHVNSISANLAGTSNFKYALTTDSTDCIKGVIEQGNFVGATTDTQKRLLHSKAYDSTTSETYYLWIWLDAAETDNATQNGTFSFSLGGVCTDQEPSDKTIYTANLSEDDEEINYNYVTIGSALPDYITQYETADDAMNALKTAGGGTVDYPYFLKHTIENGVVTESYIGFVITREFAAAHSGLTPGVYYLRGDNMYYYDPNADDWYCYDDYRDPNTYECFDSQYYESNVAVLLSAFGSGYCSSGYVDGFGCGVDEFNDYMGASADPRGILLVNNDLNNGSSGGCGISEEGESACQFY